MKKIIIIAFIYLACSVTAQAQWSPINGPFNNKGSDAINCIVTDGNKIFAVSSTLGVYCTVDDGLHWTAFNNGLNIGSSPYRDFSSISINGNNIYLASNYGVYISSINYDNWTLSKNGFNSDRDNTASINSLAFNGNQIYATSYYGLYTSFDNGLSWSLLNNTKYLTSVIYDSGKIYISYYGGGIKVSSDNGNNWSTICGQVIINYQPLMHVQSMLIDNGKIYAAIGNNNGYLAIISSIDGGVSWQSLSNSTPGITGVVKSMVKTGQNIFITLSTSTFKTSDNGLTWSNVAGLNFTNSVLATYGSKILIGKQESGNYDANLLLSNDFGNNWIPINYNLTEKNIKSFAILNSKIVCDGDWSGYYSLDYGNDWHSGKYVKNTLLKGSTFYSTGGKNLYSSNDGISWKLINSTTMDSEIVTLKAIGTTLYASTYYNVYKSIDDGVNWTILSNFGYVNNILINGTIIYLTQGNSVLKSNDNGLTWINITPSNLTSSIVTSVLKDSDIYIGTAGVNKNGAPISQGLFKSSNGGVSWTNANTGLVPFIAVDMIAQGTNIYAVTKNYNNSIGYVFMSYDNGGNWIMISDSSLNSAIPQKLVLDGLYLYCGTSTNGLWRNEISSFPKAPTPPPVYYNNECWLNISAGQNHNLAIKSDHTLWAWGSNSRCQLGSENYFLDRLAPIQIGNATDWTEVSSGVYHSLAIKTDGSLWRWGSNYLPYSSNTPNYPYTPEQFGNSYDWKTISGSGDTNYAIKTNGTLWTWGNNGGNPIYIPIQVGNDTDWKSISAGNGHTLAIKNNGSLWAISGYNDNGQLGVGLNYSSSYPAQVGTDYNWKSVSCGGASSMGFKTDGSLWTWGYNGSGQLGIGSRVNSDTPVKVGLDLDWDHGNVGQYQSIAIKVNGSVFAWGSNGMGLLGVGQAIGSSTSPMQIGTDVDWKSISLNNNCTFLIKNNSTLWTCGRNNSYGILGLGSNINSTYYSLQKINCNTLSTSDFLTDSNLINIYPNPTNSGITIDLRKQSNLIGSQIKITNLLVQDIFNSMIYQEIIEIPLSSVATKGLYFISIVNSEGKVIANKKIILN